jgi:hypothetical protein
MLAIRVSAGIDLNVELSGRIMFFGLGGNLFVGRQEVLGVAASDARQVHQVDPHQLGLRDIALLDLNGLNHFLEDHLVAADGLLLLVDADLLLLQLVKEPFHPVIVLILDHLSACLLFLSLELLDGNIILLLLRLENLRVDLGVIEHVGEHVLEILNAQALEASQNIGDISLD